MAAKHDVIIVGAGHNGLVAAAYLSRAGKKVLVLEAAPEVGGATASVRTFPEFDARLSRYSYLISLFPDKIISDLQLDFRSLSRSVSSYTPYLRNGRHHGLHVSRSWDNETEDSFRELTGNAMEARSWRMFYNRIGEFAAKVAPSMLEPMPTRRELRNRAGMDDIWRMMMERPIGETILENFQSDIVRGVVLTDALIGTHSSAFDMQANRCFLYHLLGNGTGEWKVPKGGMGALVTELRRSALAGGAEIRTDARVRSVDATADKVTVEMEDGTAAEAGHLLCNAAPQVLARLMGREAPPSLEGSQIKINMLLTRLPAFGSGADPKRAFAGTLHLGESFSELEKAYEQSRAGRMPTDLPAEIYCHTITDPSILSKELQYKGYHTLTLFGLHTPAALFDADNAAAGRIAAERALASLNRHLAEPIEDCLARSSSGEPCMEVKTPIDLEASIALPRGNIFHRDLSFPFREEGDRPGWGVETDHPRVLLCGAGAVRGGGVSGIPGHNAAMAVLGSDGK